MSAGALGALVVQRLALRVLERLTQKSSAGLPREADSTAQFQRSTEQERSFAAHVSHELRTPVVGLTTASEYLATTTTEASPETREAVEIVVHHARRLGRLVEELLELAELGAGEAAIRIEPIYLRRLVEAVLSRAGRDAPIDGPEVVTSSDKRRLERIVSNLVTNAYEHGEGREVRISIGSNGRYCWISVSDEGPGIPPADVPRLFEHFFQGERSVERRRGGIGMGLPIAMENARLLGGILRVDAPSRGTRISVELPLRAVPDP